MTMIIKITLPDEFEPFFEFLERDLGLKREDYINSALKREIRSRNEEIGIF